MELESKIEDALYEADILQSTLLAIWTAMYEGHNDFKEYESALHGVCVRACDLRNYLDALTDEAFALQKAGKAGENNVKG